MITDVAEEIYVSMSRNKRRIALTGFSIAWGIFMLIVLLGAGNGLMHAVSDEFASRAVNRVTLYPGRTTIDYEGLSKGRKVWLDASDLDFLCSSLREHVYEAIPQLSKSGRLSHGHEYVSVTANGVYPNFLDIEGVKVAAGRSINEVDIRERRKVCLLKAETLEILFGDSEPHLGEWVNLYDIPFQIIGTYKKGDSYGSNHDIYAPLSAINAIFQPDGHFDQVTLRVRNLETKEANEQFFQDVRSLVGRHKQFDATDRNALWIWNAYEDYIQTQTIFSGLQMFIWIIGIATLIAGVTGISNIMLITVRERTREFGIRKAIGARPRQILSLVLLESVAITLVFGYIGMFFGIGLTQLISFVMSNLSASTSSDGDSVTMFKDPTVDLGIVLMATLVMVIAGVIAGYIPAKRAVSIKPVEALQTS